jgi:pimeloyl-ACP methyl ester carboxylesterase
MRKRVLPYFIILLFPIFAFGIKPDTTYLFTPSNYGLMYKELKIKTSDNILLNAWFYPAQELISMDSMKYYQDGDLIRTYVVDESIKKPTIIICDGDANNMIYLISYACFLCSNGYNVLTFDWRGFGKSQKWTFDNNIVCTEFITDYNAVLDTLVNLPCVDNNRIGAYGFSTGAYISFLQFSKRKEIKALVVRGMFTSYLNVVNNLDIVQPDYPYIFDDDDYKAIEIAKNITKPVLFIVGENDDRTPKEMSIKLLSQINSFVRDLWIVKGAGHGGNIAPEIVEWDNFKQRMIDFFRQNL